MPTAATAESRPPAEVEAARYALLRRLAPSMRHHLVVNLQPIGMIYEVMDRRLRAPVPDLAHVHDSARKINGFARAALDSCLDVVGWLAPDDSIAVGLTDGVRECTGLLATSFGFRGYALRNEPEAESRQVRRSALRSVFTAALIHCTDHAPSPSELSIGLAVDADAARIRIDVRATGGEPGFAGETNYRRIAWEDLQALAGADEVRIEREDGCLRLQLPWMPGAA